MTSTGTNTVGAGKITNIQPMVWGCENAINLTKFKRPTFYKARYCIDETKDYVLQGNWNTNVSQMIYVNIERCDRTKNRC